MNYRENNILHAYDCDDQGRMTTFFFSPSGCVRLAREFPYVMIMGSAYNVNKHVMIAPNVLSLSFLNH